MEEIGAFWTYYESLDDVKQKLLYSSMELQRLKMESEEQMRRHRQDVKQLLELINTSNKERDELQNILNKLISCHSPESPLLVPVNPNSSITESNSHNSLNSSPVDSFFDAVSSPDSSNTRISPRLAECHPVSKVKVDPIDSIVKGKMLPQKGKLLEAVTEAGPLLQTLLVAGPLPQWRNPPLLHTFKIPPVSIKGCETAVNNSGARKHPSNVGSSQMCSSSSVLSFTKRQKLR